MSQVDQAAIRESGLGLEDMTAEEIAAMLDDDDDEEFSAPPAPSKPIPAVPQRRDSPDWDMADEASRPGPMFGNDFEPDPLAAGGMDLDMDTNEDDYNETFIPMTQIDARAGSNRDKVSCIECFAFNLHAHII